jgi:hypothetical protein
MRNVSHLAIAALTLSVSLAGSAYAADPVKVGVTVTQSPPGSVVQGTQVKDGLEVAAKMLNDQGSAGRSSSSSRTRRGCRRRPAPPSRS